LRLLERHPALPRFVLLWLSLGATLASCHRGSPVQPGGFLVRFGNSGFSISRAADGAELVASYPGKSGQGAYAPFATRDGSATWQELYGQFKVTEADVAWSQARAMEVDPQDPLHAFFLDDSGARAGELRASSPSS
jgi:hypothetical protein